MKKSWLFFVLKLMLAGKILAIPSSVFWTNCTTQVWEAGVMDFSLVDVFSPYKTRHHRTRSLPTEIGIELGLFDLDGIEAEAGLDYFVGTDAPWVLNGKLAIKENKLFRNAPSFSVGIFGIGTRSFRPNPTNANIVDVVVGKSLYKPVRNFYVGAYAGGKALGRDQSGFMVAYIDFFCLAKDCEGDEYYKWFFAADYASGKNSIGGGGFGFGHYFTPNISMLAGPVWFNDTKLLGNWKFLLEFDVSFTALKNPLKKKEKNGSKRSDDRGGVEEQDH